MFWLLKVDLEKLLHFDLCVSLHPFQFYMNYKMYYILYDISEDSASADSDISQRLRVREKRGWGEIFLKKKIIYWYIHSINMYTQQNNKHTNLSFPLPHFSTLFFFQLLVKVLKIQKGESLMKNKFSLNVNII